MKSIIATLAVRAALILSIGAPAHAFTGMGLDQIRSEGYKVESRGTDFRIYQ